MSGSREAVSLIWGLQALSILGSLLVVAFFHYGSKTISRALSAQEIVALGNVKYLDSLFGFLLLARLLVPGHSSKDRGQGTRHW